MTSDPQIAFTDLGLSDEVLSAVTAVGYESPSPIQAAAIPVLLRGGDLVGQAQTGTGKTAAFALPLLSRLDLALQQPQILVLAPTRELAIQVAEAFQTYSRGLPGFHVLPVYGGQAYDIQLRRLRRGVHAIVGTPGRILDHLRRGTLKLDAVTALVLDEADEMLRMGFLDDVEEILGQAPDEKQVALFSATMPPAIARVAQKYLRDPEEIRIQAPTATVETVRQRYWRVRGIDKLDALTRILEVEDFDAMIAFVRTKVATVDLAEKLEARGFSSAPLNGDMNQSLRERTVDRLKKGKLDIVVATDVAARGLDVERISHVINFDVPYDVEAYIHRIGRTGRAGREGQAILFVSHREQRMLRSIERATRQAIEPMRLPSRQDVTARRVEELETSLRGVFEGTPLERFDEVVADLREKLEVDATELAGALLVMVQRDRPLFPVDAHGEDRALRGSDAFEARPDRGRDRDRGDRPPPRRPQGQLERYRVEVGRQHGVQVKNIVGAIANEANLDIRSIGRIDLHDEWSTVELPEGMPREIFDHLSGVWVCGRELRLSRDRGPAPAPRTPRPRSPGGYSPPKKKLGGKKKFGPGPGGRTFGKKKSKKPKKH